MALYANLKKGDALEYMKIFGINDTNSRRFAYAEDIYEIEMYPQWPWETQKVEIKRAFGICQRWEKKSFTYFPKLFDF